MEEWYAVQVMTGREADIAKLCSHMISGEILLECFIPKYERMKRYQAEWNKEQIIMFPGYLFMITGQVEQLFRKLKQVPTLTKILGDGTMFIPLTQLEVDFLQKIGNEKHLVEMSVGYLEGEQVIITSGPLQKMPGVIRKIDRHKRIAVVSVNMFGRQQDVTVGVEIVGKADKK